MISQVVLPAVERLHTEAPNDAVHYLPSRVEQNGYAHSVEYGRHETVIKSSSDCDDVLHETDEHKQSSLQLKRQRL